MTSDTSATVHQNQATTTILAANTWRERESRHQDRVDALVSEHLHRRRRGERHPVQDFLFTYYSHRPAQLRRWHPGVGTLLAHPTDGEPPHRGWRYYTDHLDQLADHAPPVGLDVATFTAERGATVRFVAALLEATEARSANLGCFGLHEWAMVYRTSPGNVRHQGVPLRLGSAGTDAVVESHRIRCSHYDAYRFFTDDAVPRNQLRPTRTGQISQEQPGCLHATMDCYKWAYKLTPAVPSELVLECFELARDVRELDMRASPYDLSAWGYTPVRIETAEGKAQYVAAQREFAERGRVVRNRLLAVCRQLLGHPDAVGTEAG
ncbi:3-methyladenine DNA glycosylase [Lipingzhangella sp. LS1_29]|uniref:3-methyladenine DNA glycosylase n=1 Tax=Lipingzhangella rawalii TaxID=2055835 RepID=A0ABU2H5K7_9ACTN|nr:3-methyladenine DNA glycosylase [Lipingzhangella rawalii]MDS1270597.1 3-methyladenine DNA glycosylase [Lipingzhangella rawalii]